MAAEQRIYDLCHRMSDVRKINLEKTSEFVENSRGQKLHVRSFWPDLMNHRATVIFLHGYASHGSRPTHRYVSAQMLANGIGYVCLDFHGHGYSQGERALVTSVEDLIDDVISLLKVLYCEEDVVGDQRRGGRVGDSFYADSTPFYFMGQSMGATVSMLVGNIIKTQPDLLNGAVSKLFRGCILMSPAITLDGPNAVLRSILENFLVPCFPTSPIPHFLTPGGSTERLVWRNESFIDYIRMDDGARTKHGLSYFGQIKFQTGSTLLNLGMEMEAIIPQIRFPFLILHDPRDHISNITGSIKLLEQSRTLDDRKCYVEIDGGLHDLLSNKLTFVTDRSIEWMNEQMLRDKSA